MKKSRQALDYEEILAREENDKDRECITLTVMSWLGILAVAAYAGSFGCTLIRQYNSYAKLNIRGTIVDTWTRHKSGNFYSFVVMETLSYVRAGVQGSCTMEGKSYETQQIADVVGREVVRGQTRVMHVPLHASEHSCLTTQEYQKSLQGGIVLLLLSALIFTPFVCMLALLLRRAIQEGLKKMGMVSGEEATTTSPGTEMTPNGRTVAFIGYVPVSIGDDAALASVRAAPTQTACAELIYYEGDEKYIHVLV
jgi:hypothetical protein